MSTITISIADDDLAFLNVWAQEQGTTVEAFFSKEAANLRQHLGTPLHPLLVKASGVIKTAEAEGNDQHQEYLEAKYQ